MKKMSSFLFFFFSYAFITTNLKYDDYDGNDDEWKGLNIFKFFNFFACLVQTLSPATAFLAVAPSLFT